MKHGIPHGEGTLEGPDGSFYTGQFSDGVKCGKGKLKHRDGRTHEGFFAHDMENGLQKWAHADGEVYFEGMIENNNIVEFSRQFMVSVENRRR